MQPQFDIAWLAKGVHYLGEVKSITPANFVHQVRLAVGQVLRYRWELGGSMEPVVVISAPPLDDSWRSFLSDIDVSFVWRTGGGSFTSGRAAPPW